VYAKAIPDPTMLELAIAVTETIPIKILKCYSRLPHLGSKKLRDQAKLAETVSNKMYDMQSIFHHFINNSWIFETEQCNKLLSVMA